jgi:hypothetical protein
VLKESVVVSKGREPSKGVLYKCDGHRIYSGKVSAPKKKEGFPMFFVIPNLITCASNPGVRELIFVASSIDLLRKRRVMIKMLMLAM